jgi:hypothetical protein
MNYDNEMMHDMLMKPAVVGVFGGAVSAAAVVPWNLKVMGMPAPVGLGLVMGVASGVSASLNEVVYEKFLSESESELLYNSTRPIITGLATAGAARMVIGPTVGWVAMGQLFVLGAASEIGGSYVHDSLLGPAMDL